MVKKLQILMRCLTLTLIRKTSVVARPILFSRIISRDTKDLIINKRDVMNMLLLLIFRINMMLSKIAHFNLLIHRKLNPKINLLEVIEENSNLSCYMLCNFVVCRG